MAAGSGMLRGDEGAEATGGDGDAPLTLPALLMVAALAVATVGQGGYYPPLQPVIAVLLAAAVAVGTVWERRARGAGRVSPLARLAPVLVAATTLAAWALARGAVGGGWSSGLGAAALLSGIVAVLVVCSRAPPGDREPLVAAAIVLGVLLACSGMVGVALRMEPWALQDQQLWRAAGTLTYANAAAGFLVPLTLLSAAEVVERPRSAPRVVALCLLLAGVGATLSRGGGLALLVGAIVLTLLIGLGPALRALGPPALGAGVALAGLAPSMQAERAPEPALAVAGLAAGVAIAVMISRMPPIGVATGLAAGLIWFLAVGSAAPPTLIAVVAPRMSLASPDRVYELEAALRLVADRPLVGVGPGNAMLVLTGEAGQVRVARYVHNEYVQVLAELGAVGGVLLLALLVAAAWLLLQSRRDARPPARWAGIAAGLTAFGLHSSLDFLWHLPVLPLTAALLFGLTMPSRKDPPCSAVPGPASPPRSVAVSPSPP